MSTITISDLSPTGLDLFLDSENYIDELSDGDMTSINGGISPTIIPVTIRVTIVTAIVVTLIVAAPDPPKAN